MVDGYGKEMRVSRSEDVWVNNDVQQAKLPGYLVSWLVIGI